MTILVDRLRQGFYGLALLVAVGSLWVTGWANARQQCPAWYASPAVSDVRPGQPAMVPPPAVTDDQ